MMRLIDADALANNITVLCKKNKECIDDWLRNYIEDEITDAPTIEAEPVKMFGEVEKWLVHGHWIGKSISGYSTVRCSVCRSVFSENNGKWNYCPDCGAKMDEVGE